MYRLVRPGLHESAGLIRSDYIDRMDGIIGREIQRARLNLGWSRATLADECGITVADIESIENGDRGEHVDRVLAVLQLDVVTMIMPQAHADFLRAVRPIIAGVPPERLALAFGAIMSARSVARPSRARPSPPDSTSPLPTPTTATPAKTASSRSPRPRRRTSGGPDGSRRSRSS